jgi:putative oxidoreductase
MQRLGRVVLWLLQIALAAMFVLAGVAKFAAGSAWPRMFARWGYPDGFYLVVGAAEALAGVALLAPRAAPVSAAVLIVIMIGAGWTHLTHGEAHRVPQNVVMALMLAIVAWGRRSSAFGTKIKR